jgi:hypothetical protein
MILALWVTGAAGLFGASAVAQVDPLDAALERAGMRRADLGWTPQGWWTHYPRDNWHQLSHVEDLTREPLLLVPFTRTLAQGVREFLAKDGSGSYELYDLVHVAVDRRYGGIRGGGAGYFPAPAAASLDESILELYRYSGEPTRFVTQNVEVSQPDLAAEIKARSAQLPPEVSRILGRLVLDLVEAHRWAALAFRDVTLEQHVAIGRPLDYGLETIDGLQYGHVHVLDDVARSWDEGSLWYAGLKCVDALERARVALEKLSLPPRALDSLRFDWQTPLGWIRVRGTSADVIDASESLLIVDLGGNDTWRGPAGASSPTRLLGLALDMSGNDVYDGDENTQGAGVAGVGILLDAAGNDRYGAKRYAQGVGQFGLGALIDLGGDDLYRAAHAAQGSAPFVGVAVLADANGDDRYEVLADGQGFGGPGAVAILADRAGSDTYRAEPDARQSGRRSYNPDSLYSSSSAQGVGVGRYYGHAAAHSWAGGLGALIDIEGRDTYLAGNWAQAMGYWFGTGIMYDGSGSDHYEAGGGSTQSAASHFGIAALIDDGGDDVHLLHEGRGFASAHDFSVALFLANGGSDRYTSGKWICAMACSLNRSTAMFIDVEGNDVYRGASGTRPGFAEYNARLLANPDGTAPDVHPWTLMNYFAYVSSLGLFLDVGGADGYWGGPENGDSWGDRPGSENWRARNIGVGMDVPSGTIDWSARPQAK